MIAFITDDMNTGKEYIWPNDVPPAMMVGAVDLLKTFVHRKMQIFETVYDKDA